MSYFYSFFALDDTGSKVLRIVPLWNLDKGLHTLSSLLPM